MTVLCVCVLGRRTLVSLMSEQHGVQVGAEDGLEVWLGPRQRGTG